MEGEKRFSIFKATHTHETVLFALSSHVFVNEIRCWVGLYSTTVAIPSLHNVSTETYST